MEKVPVKQRKGKDQRMTDIKVTVIRARNLAAGGMIEMKL